MKKIMNSECPVCKNKTLKYYECTFNEIVGITNKYIQNLSICDNCQLIFTTNPLDNKIIEKYYKELSKYEGIYGLGKVDYSKEKMTKRQFSFLKNNINDFSSVLDVGASTGFNLNTFKTNGYNVYGVEPSKKNVEYAKNFYGIEMFPGTFEEYFKSKNKKSFDLIFLSHILEHIADPCNFLKNIRKINDKYLFIEVPDMDIQFLDEPFGMFFYEHVNYFSIESLTNLMILNKYRPLKINIEMNVEGESPGYPCIVSIWEKIEDITNFKFDIANKSKNILENYIEKSEKKFDLVKNKIDKIDNNLKIAIWGTGSHTSRLLGMTNLINKNIIKFYDSDPKKYQFKIMGKEITNYSAEDVFFNKIEAIFISTFYGEKYLKNFLLKENLKNVQIITLYD